MSKNLKKGALWKCPVLQFSSPGPRATERIGNYQQSFLLPNSTQSSSASNSQYAYNAIAITSVSTITSTITCNLILYKNPASFWGLYPIIWMSRLLKTFSSLFTRSVLGLSLNWRTSVSATSIKSSVLFSSNFTKGLQGLHERNYYFHLKFAHDPPPPPPPYLSGFFCEFWESLFRVTLTSNTKSNWLTTPK